MSPSDGTIDRGLLGRPTRKWIMIEAPDAWRDRVVGREVELLALYDTRQGAPVPPFTGLRDEARDLASFASQDEVRAYLAACWNRLPEAEQASFRRAAT